jgi:ABC-type dipeptide/oligopeptide/nickel transport system permease subunit
LTTILLFACAVAWLFVPSTERSVATATPINELKQRPILVAGLLALGLLVLAALVGPWLAADPRALSTETLLGPSLSHPLGTDLLGRDLLSRALHGVRRALWFGSRALVVGFVPGAVAGGLIAHYRPNLARTCAGLDGLARVVPVFVLLLSFTLWNWGGGHTVWPVSIVALLVGLSALASFPPWPGRLGLPPWVAGVSTVVMAAAVRVIAVAVLATATYDFLIPAFGITLGGEVNDAYQALNAAPHHFIGAGATLWLLLFVLAVLQSELDAARSADTRTVDSDPA